MSKTPRLYRSGHYFNGMTTRFGGTRTNAGYFSVKAFQRHASTHRLVAWNWPRGGLRPVMPWAMDVDHIDADRSSLNPDNLQWLTRRQHGAKTKGARLNDAKSDPIRGRMLGSDDWRHFPSLSEARRQTGCSMDAISNTANPNKKMSRTVKGGDVWVWEWCAPSPDREGEEWHECVLPDGTVVTQVQVSNMGAFKKRTSTKVRKLAGCLEKNGYRRIWVQGRLYLTHVLVALAWLPPPPDGATLVDHIDCQGPKDDNRASNLRWVTPAENIANSVRAPSGPARSTSVQPFFDAACTLPAHDPFPSQHVAAQWASVKSSSSIVHSMRKRAAGGALHGRPLYWQKVASPDPTESSVPLSPEMMEHVRLLAITEQANRLRAEDARLPLAKLLVEASAPIGSAVFFEDVDNERLQFVAVAGDETLTLGSAACDDVHRLTARHGDGVWRVYELAKQTEL